jgi:hypothetical protein
MRDRFQRARSCLDVFLLADQVVNCVHTLLPCLADGSARRMDIIEYRY